MKIDWKRVDTLIELALSEDLDKIGDATSDSVIPAASNAQAYLFCKEDCVVAGLGVAERVFKKLDSGIKWKSFVKDGDFCRKSAKFAEFAGKAGAVLTAERTALNFLQRMSGTATVSKKYSSLTEGTKTVILDTRKTTPGWRNLEKYAVKAGGSENHRMGLYDRIMIKDNHREIAGYEGPGGIERSVERARKKHPELEIEVEADTLDEVKDALDAGADYILLDNMTDEEMLEAVLLNKGSSKLEASGGISIERIPEIIKCGVDYISVGALTHSVKAIDISMEIKAVS